MFVNGIYENLRALFWCCKEMICGIGAVHMNKQSFSVNTNDGHIGPSWKENGIPTVVVTLRILLDSPIYTFLIWF